MHEWFRSSRVLTTASKSKTFYVLFKKRFKLNFDLCWSAYCFFNIGPTGQHKPTQLQSVNIQFLCVFIQFLSILCVFISLLPLLSHNFLSFLLFFYIMRQELLFSNLMHLNTILLNKLNWILSTNLNFLSISIIIKFLLHYYK